MYSRITKSYCRKTVGPIFTKPVQIEGTTKTFTKHTDLHIAARRKSHPLPLWGQYLNTVLQGRWIRRASRSDQPLMLWPPRSPDITPRNFFFGDMSNALPLPRDLADLRAWIITAVKFIDAPMLTRVCDKNLNIVSTCACRVTRGAHRRVPAVSPVVHIDVCLPCHPWCTSTCACRVTRGAHRRVPAVSPAVHTSNISSCQTNKKKTFSLAVNNSINSYPANVENRLSS
jgi:ribosomal protein L31